MNGVESALSQQGVVAAPFVAPPAHFELPLEACAEGAYVHNKLAGDISVDCNNTLDGVYDYSYGVLRDLDEDSLLESEGICNHAPMDWNGDGPISSSEIAWNINGDKVCDYRDGGCDAGGLDAPLINEFVDDATAHSSDPLRDHCDWCYLSGIGVKRH